MAKEIYVTGAQKDAARTLVKRSATTGRQPSPNVRRIADAPAKSVKKK
jgi:hypothetical protein